MELNRDSKANVNRQRKIYDPWKYISKFGSWPVLLFSALAILTPVYILFKISVSKPQDILTQEPPLWIENFTFDHWIRVIEGGNLWAPLWKSFFVATLTAVVAILLAAPASYVISLLSKKIRYSIIVGLLFTKMFPDVGISLPIAVNFIKLNLLDTSLGLILAHLIPNLPFLAWILVGTFSTIPRDMEKAAMIDGATRLQALTKVIFPIAAPGIAVGAMYVWLNSWNEFTFAVYLTMSENTLPLQTYYYIVRGDWFQSSAYAMVLTIPVIVITYFLQRYMKSGYLSGAIKG